MCIYDGDEFKYHIENARIVIDSHLQDFLNIDKDKIIGAYAIVTMDDGSQYVELMSMAMIKQSWKQGFGYKENGSGTHQKFTDQMAMKTVKNRALKYIIRTYGTQAVNDAYDNVESTETDDKTAIDVENDIAENANSKPFIVDVDATTVIEDCAATEQNADVVDAEDSKDDSDGIDF